MTFKEYIEKNNIRDDIIFLDYTYSNLTNLDGIENLIYLKDLYRHNNQLTSLKQIDRLKI